jgi:hypothetical protein
VLFCDREWRLARLHGRPITLDALDALVALVQTIYDVRSQRRAGAYDRQTPRRGGQRDRDQGRRLALALWRFARRREREALVQLGLVVHILARPRCGGELGSAARRVGAHCLGGCHGKLNLLKPAKGRLDMVTLVEGKRALLPSVQSLYVVESELSLRTRLARA